MCFIVLRNTFYRPIMRMLLKIEAGGLRLQHKCKALRVESVPFLSLLATLWLPGTSEAAARLGLTAKHFYHDVWNFKGRLLISYCWLLGFFS